MIRAALVAVATAILASLASLAVAAPEPAAGDGLAGASARYVRLDPLDETKQLETVVAIEVAPGGWTIDVDGRRLRTLSPAEVEDLRWAVAQATPSLEHVGEARGKLASLASDPFVLDVRKSTGEVLEVSGCKPGQPGAVGSLFIAIAGPATLETAPETPTKVRGPFSARVAVEGSGAGATITLHDVVFAPKSGAGLSDVGRPLFAPGQVFTLASGDPFLGVLRELGGKTIRAVADLGLDGSATVSELEATTAPGATPATEPGASGGTFVSSGGDVAIVREVRGTDLRARVITPADEAGERHAVDGWLPRGLVRLEAKPYPGDVVVESTPGLFGAVEHAR